MRLAEVQRNTGIEFCWRPFSVRQIMIEQDNIPFRTKPVKAAYMWRDIERRAAMYGLPARVPVPYPLAEWDTANRVAVLAATEGWVTGYARATYRRWFQEGLEPGSEPNLSDSLRGSGKILRGSPLWQRRPKLERPMRQQPARRALLGYSVHRLFR
jgi:2-hydroxychromene-2-carboxylate isomerase